jgi:hypothetical protein
VKCGSILFSLVRKEMPIAEKANTDRIRGYNLKQMQSLNKLAANSLADASRLGPFWGKLGMNGTKLATEMTNRIAEFTNLQNVQMFCDARRWVSQAGLLFVPATAEYMLVVRYNSTRSKAQKDLKLRESDQHFFNLEFQQKGQPPLQIAHITIFTTVDPVDAHRHPMSYTPLGFLHLKDDLALGRLDTVSGTLVPGVPSEHAILKQGRKRGDPVKLTQSIRRFFIQTVVLPPVATASTAATPAIPIKTVYRIGFQNQIGNVSSMAIRFSQVVLQVLQEYFDAGFSVAGFKTPANPQYFKADPMCKAPANATYNSLQNIGKRTDIAEPQGSPGARLAALRALPSIGGRKKTRRSKKSRRETRKNNA